MNSINTAAINAYIDWQVNQISVHVFTVHRYTHTARDWQQTKHHSDDGGGQRRSPLGVGSGARWLTPPTSKRGTDSFKVRSSAAAGKGTRVAVITYYSCKHTWNTRSAWIKDFAKQSARRLLCWKTQRRFALCLFIYCGLCVPNVNTF